MPPEDRNSVMDLVNLSVRQAVRKARWRYTMPPLAILGIVLMGMALFSLPDGFSHFFSITPDVLIIGGIGVMFFGAWYDFGAIAYEKELKDHYRKSLTDQDATYINKQQLIMTLIYIGIGFLYIAVGTAIYLTSIYIYS